MSEDPVGTVLGMVRGAWVTMLLRATAVLGICDLLDVPRPVTELAQRTGTDAPTLARMLRSLADLGLLERVGAEGYRTTPLGDCLREDHPSRTRDLVLMQATLPNLAAWHALEDAVRTGSGVYEQVNGVPSWEHLAQDPEAQRVFNAAMARRATGQVAAVRAAVDLSEVVTLVDVGGGRGAMLQGLLEAVPSLTGVVADQPAMAAEADAIFESAGLSARARGIPCDFFVSVPGGGDLYTISNVLHDWDDAEAVAILRTVRTAMPDHARLLAVEHVLDAPGRPADQLRDLHLVDLHMLVLFGARERTHAEYDALLAAAGFTPSRLAEPVTEWNVLEARPVG
jgi:DNA-binding HxlR family transcriptional regulator